LSSVTSIAVEWSKVSASDNIPVTGYYLFMDDGYYGDFDLMFVGGPFGLSYTAQGLVSGLPYRFYVQAENQNGLGPESDITTIYSCLVPSVTQAPTKVDTTQSSITLKWQEPEENGCPITGFTLYRDTGSYDAISISVDPSQVELRPSLRQWTVESLSNVDHTYKFKVRAYNNAGYSDS